MSREAGTGRTVSEKAIGYLYGLQSVGEEKAYLMTEVTRRINGLLLQSLLWVPVHSYMVSEH